jgi:hypothetical protein
MNLTGLWEHLEGDAPADRVGRMMQRIRPESAIDLFATLETGPGGTRRAVELHVRAVDVAGVEAPEGSGGVECRIESLPPDRAALVLALLDPGSDELFAAMCEDVTAAAAACGDERDAVGIWLGRFAKWRRMLRGGLSGLSPERQRGLFAELLTIRDRLIPILGFDESIRAWQGPDGAPRDFESGGIGLEVKASAANEPQVVPINGERQLDDAGLDGLLLLHESLEVLRDTGQTLNGVVSGLRALGSGHPEAGKFEDRLLQAGYADTHAPRYRRTGYALRRTSVFQVGPGFPRITEGDLADGVGAVHYRLAIDACRDWEVNPDAIRDALSRSGAGA